MAASRLRSRPRRWRESAPSCSPCGTRRLGWTPLWTARWAAWRPWRRRPGPETEAAKPARHTRWSAWKAARRSARGSTCSGRAGSACGGWCCTPTRRGSSGCKNKGHQAKALSGIDRRFSRDYRRNFGQNVITWTFIEKSLTRLEY